MTKLMVLDAPAVNGTDVTPTADTLAELASTGTVTPDVRPVSEAFADLPESIRTAIATLTPAGATLDTFVADNGPTARTHRSLTVGVITGHGATLPAGAGDFATYTIGSSSKPLDEYDAAVRPIAAIRGGAIGFLPFGYREDKYGFRHPDVVTAKKYAKGIEAAFTRLPRAEWARADQDVRVVSCNDGGLLKAGYILFRFFGFNDRAPK